MCTAATHKPDAVLETMEGGATRRRMQVMPERLRTYHINGPPVDRVERTTREALPRGSVLGVFGGGQLGLMFAEAAQALGYRVHVYAPESDPPASRVAAQHTCAPYEDVDAARRFAHTVGAVTYEFENIPPETIRAIDGIVPVRPAPRILAITRNRLREKEFLQERGLPVTPFAAARTLEETRSLLEGGPMRRRSLQGEVSRSSTLQSPLTRPVEGEATAGAQALRRDKPAEPAPPTGFILKTTELGYDGKGQVPVPNADVLSAAWDTLGNPHEIIVEERIDLAGECSVIIARDTSGRYMLYGPFHNEHRNHILDITTWTAEQDSEIARRSREIGLAVAEAFDLVGMICVELFIARDDAIMVNEIAPRPHNSGHLTIEACSVSQFAQQALLTAGHPATPWEPKAPAAAMANLLGDLWANGEPNWSTVQDVPDVTLHLYGKKGARAGRKMGHLTALADTAEHAREQVLDARARLTRS